MRGGRIGESGMSFTPVSGEVVAVNDALVDPPETVNSAPDTMAGSLKSKSARRTN